MDPPEWRRVASILLNRADEEGGGGREGTETDGGGRMRCAPAPWFLGSVAVATRSSPSTKRRPAGRAQSRPRRPVQRRATPADWIAGARPRTLPLAIAPVALGTGAAY